MYQKMGISQPAHQLPQRLELGVVDPVHIAAQREQLHAEVKPLASQLGDRALKPRQFAGLAPLALPNLRQGDEAVGVAANRLGVVLVDVGAVYVVALQYADVDPGDLHLGDHPFRRGLQVLQAGRVELHDEVDAVNRDFGLTVAAHAEADVGHGVDVVGGKVEQRLLDARAVALAPEVGEVAQMVLPQLERERGAGRARTGGKAAKDMAVGVDDERSLLLLGFDGPPAAAEKLHLSFSGHLVSIQD